MKELSLIVDAAGLHMEKHIVVEMKKPINHYLVEKVMINQVAVKDVIHQNMLQIWKLLGTVTSNELNKA
jgi:hypothetical protein